MTRQEEFTAAFIAAIKEVGIPALKQTSMFGSAECNKVGSVHYVKVSISE